MFKNGKEIDKKLHEIEDEEQLETDCVYIQNIKNKINNTANKQIEDIKEKFIKKNIQLSASEILAVLKFVEYYKQSIRA